MEQFIQFEDIINFIKKYFLLILSVTILLGGSAYALSEYVLDKEYRSQAQLLINQSSGESQEANYLDIQTNVSMINTLVDIMFGDKVLQQVSDQMDNRYSVGELEYALNYSHNFNSQVFTVESTLPEPEDAQTSLALLIEAFDTTFNDIYELPEEQSSMSVISQPDLNENPTSPNIPVNIIIGTLIGFFIGLILSLSREISDDKIRDEAFFERMGLVKLGQIRELSGRELKDTRLTNKNVKKKDKKDKKKEKLEEKEKKKGAK